MPNDLSIQTARGITVGDDVAWAARTLSAEPPPGGQATPETLPTPNPTLELDAALGLVVIQFRNDSGTVTSSIPSQQQLDAYRLWQETRIGPPPNLGGAVAPADAASARPVVAVAPASGATGPAAASAAPSVVAPAPAQPAHPGSAGAGQASGVLGV